MSAAVYTGNAFSIRPSAYAAYVSVRRIVRWAPAIIAVYVLLGVLAARGDLRYLFVMLILTFMIYPFALVLGWFATVASPWCVRNVGLQRWIFGDEGIKVEYLDVDGMAFDVFECSWDAVAQMNESRRRIYFRLDDNRINTDVHMPESKYDAILIAPSDVMTDEAWEFARKRLCECADEPLA